MVPDQEKSGREHYSCKQDKNWKISRYVKRGEGEISENDSTDEC
jgi:hypothetical protein